MTGSDATGTIGGKPFTSASNTVSSALTGVTLNLLATTGSFVIAISMILFFTNIFITLRKPRTAPDDPWEANTLEWATSSPPPPHNFDRLPEVRSDRPVYDARVAKGSGS